MINRSNKLRIMIFKGFRTRVFFYLFAFLCQFQLDAQISSGGKPVLDVGLSNRLVKNSKEHAYLPTRAELKSVNSVGKSGSLKFAHQFTVNYTPENSGEWMELNDGTRVWRLLISSEGAYSINLIFDRFKLPKGSKLFIYNTDQTDIKGAYTYLNNHESGVLATSPVDGDEIIVEYQQPIDVKDEAEIMIGAVNHDYIGINSLKYNKYFNKSDETCEVDITCYDADNTLDVKRSVVRLIVNGTYACTATLINNTGDDKKPYIITAAHCLRADETANTAVVYFNYEIPHCSEIIEGSDQHSLSGAETKVYADDLDIALIEMNNKPPAYYRPYWAGWSLSTAPIKPFKAIHHPEGDVKKISTFDGDLQKSTYKGDEVYATVDNFHWRVSRWTTSATEPGSSGGPLFDANNLFVGSLSGGAAKCSNPTNDYYTRFYEAWDLRSKLSQQYKEWLDPLNSGVQSLAGEDPYKGEGFLRLSNVEKNESPISYFDKNWGFLSGHNVDKSKAFVDKYSGIKSATIKGVYFTPSSVKWGSDQTFNLVVWQGDQYPKNLIARKENIKLSELGITDADVNEERYFEFNTPVNVSGNFFVGYEISYANSPVDSMAIYYSTGSSKVNNTMLICEDAGDWKYASELYDGDKYTLWIDLLAEMVVYGDTQVPDPYSNNITIYPVPLIYGETMYINSKQRFVKAYEIVDLTGRKVVNRSLNMSGNSLAIYTSELPAGVYILNLKLEDGEVRSKFVVK